MWAQLHTCLCRSKKNLLTWINLSRQISAGLTLFWLIVIHKKTFKTIYFAHFTISATGKHQWSHYEIMCAKLECGLFLFFKACLRLIFFIFTSGVGHIVSTNVSWPANRSSSSEFSPLDRDGALLASSLNRSAGSSLLRSGWETPRLTVAGGLWTHKCKIPHGHRASESKASSVSWPFRRLWRAERKRLFGMTRAEKITLHKITKLQKRARRDVSFFHN